MSGMGNYDAWKLASPPEYEISEEEEDQRDNDEAFEQFTEMGMLDIETAPTDWEIRVVYKDWQGRYRLTTAYCFWMHRTDGDAQWKETGEDDGTRRYWGDHQLYGWIPREGELPVSRICAGCPPVGATDKLRCAPCAQRQCPVITDILF